MHRIFIGLPCLFLAGCAPVDLESSDDSALPTGSLADLGPAPGHLDPTSVDVHGHACSYTPARWAGDAEQVLRDNWGVIGALSVSGRTFGTAAVLVEHLRTASPAEAEHAALVLNVLLNDVGLFGSYADLGTAQLTVEGYAGVTADTVLAHAEELSPVTILELMGAFNAGFGSCPPEWFQIDDVDGPSDADGDGIPDAFDCEPEDDSIGAVLYDTDFDSDDGELTAPDALSDDPWRFDGTSVVASDGGQQALLGSDESYDDVVVFAEVTTQGTRPGCGFDCADVCGDYVPEDDCYSAWDAFALGILHAESSDDGVLRVENSGDYDVCLDGTWSMWDAVDTQALTIGNSESGLSEYRVPAHGSLEFFYGSWTTDNGEHSPYLGEEPWWCFQRGVYFRADVEYDLLGSLLPEDWQEFIEGETDWDGDGVEDHVDWATAYGVQTQSNMWDYQATHAVGIIGKRAASTEESTVQTTLTAQSRGALDLLGAVVTDTVPANWELVDCSLLPDSITANADDTTTLTWEIALDGCIEDCLIVDEVEITCDIRHVLPVDVDHLVLPQASIAYNDSEDDEVSYSMPAVAFDYDHDGDGEVRCGQTDRWRVGVLARAERDADQDEGFHGYRCALGSNSADDCHDPGMFIQLAEFEDAPEDDISSECEGDCPANTTFTQHGRVDHEVEFGDISVGDTVSLALWAVGDGLTCTATNAAGETVRADAEDASFGSGGFGLSTLNAFGDYGSLKVCEAFGGPR